jgi:hypothetical protein
VALSALYDTFIAEYKKRSVSMNKIVEQLQAEANAAKAEAEAARLKKERQQELQALYIPYIGDTGLRRAI